MTADSAFLRAAAALHTATVDDDLCVPFLSALPVTGVAISTVGNPFGSETVCASDAIAGRWDEIQLDLGEGPCWDAVRTGLPVLVPDVQHATSTPWPLAIEALQTADLGAVFAFPMRLGTVDLGTVDLYTRTSGTLGPVALGQASVLTQAAARQVLRRALLRIEAEPDDSSTTAAGEYSRREVHQASGMIAAQTGAHVDDALLILRAHAFAAGRTVRSLAADVVARTIDFTNRHDDAP